MRADPDPARAHSLWVRTRDELVATHPASPVAAESRAGFGGLRHAPYDLALRFVVPLDTDVEPHRLDVPTATDGVVPFERVGRFHLPVGELDVWWLDSYGGGLFVPLRDATSGSTTYGGGRYVVDTVKGADLGGDAATGFVVDLNFAYHPSCAYDSRWTCPLAPPGNTLDHAVVAGELLS